MSKILKIFNDKKYTELALKNHKKYIKNKPFPHIYFDNFLPKNVALAISKEYPKINERNKNWKVHKNKNVIRYFLEDSSRYKEKMQIFSMILNSRRFILFLETLTGIKSIISDPFFMGGGAMTTGSGGFLKVHADFNYYNKIKMYRRINIIIYLNEEWEESWNGNLEFWSEDMIKKQSYSPKLNTAIIFHVHDKAFHGYPDKINCPDTIGRKSINLYYYTEENDELQNKVPHKTIWKDTNNTSINLDKY